MLEVTGFSAGYQGNDVVHDVTFRVNQGEAVMIIGSNGAGKTTLFQAMCGLLPPSSGKVIFEGEDITGLPAERIARLGMRFVSATRHLFPRMTVEEHLLLGAYPHKPDPETMTIVLDLFPRLAEVVWSGARAYDDFSRRLKTHLKRLDQLQVNYRNPF